MPAGNAMMLLCLAAVWLAGFGLVRCMFPQALRWSLHNVLLFSLAIGAGAGVASCLYFLTLALAGPGFQTLALVEGAAVAICLALGLFAKTRGTRLDWAEGPPVPWFLTALFGLAIVLAVTMFLGAVIYNPHGEEAAWSIWNLKARFLFRAGAFWPDAFSRDLAWTRLDYPLLLPGLVALCWKLAAHESTDAPIAIAFLFALGTTGVLVGTLGVLRGKTLALLAGTLLLGTASFVALSAALYGDVPLSFYILATLALLCLQDRHPEDLRFSALAGLMAGFAAWTRNEGVVFIVALIVARVFALVRYRQRAMLAPQLLRLVAGLAVPLVVVIFFKWRVGTPGDLFSVPASAILKHLADPGRWIMTVEGLVIVFFTMGRFLIPIVLALALYWYLVRFQVDPHDRAALATAGITLGLTLAGQLIGDALLIDNLAVEINTSFERILLQLWPAALLMFFLASGGLQLAAAKPEKKANRHARRALETR
jgi:Dolichyl-phosphate-mannose-protein mannosyltransferase